MGNIGLLTTFGLMLATAWIGFIRFGMRTENNWPLIYYTILVLYLNNYDLVLNPYVVYVSVVCALFERFEFLNERMIFGIRIIEVVCLSHIGFRLYIALYRGF